MKILYVTNKIAKDVIAQRIEQIGWEVNLENEPEEVLSLCHDQSYDAMIIDLTSNEQRWIKTIKSLRDNNNFIPIACLLKENYKYKIPAFKAGADMCANHPWQPQELLLRITAIIRRHVKYQELTT